MNKIASPPSRVEIEQKIDQYILNNEENQKVHHSINEEKLSPTDLAYFRASGKPRMKYSSVSYMNFPKSSSENENMSHLSNSDLNTLKILDKTYKADSTKNKMAFTSKINLKLKLL